MREKEIGFKKLAVQDMHNPQEQILRRVYTMKMIS